MTKIKFGTSGWRAILADDFTIENVRIVCQAISDYLRENNEAETFWVRKTNLINVDLPSISGATGTLTADDSFGEWSVLGYFGRFNYNFKEKYFLEANGRYDGSSRFRQEDRFGFFPSVSAGWQLGRETFMESIGVISDLKLRASWGEVGNQNTASLYPAIPGMPVQNVSWLNESAGIPYVSLGMPGLVSSGFTWERVKTQKVAKNGSTKATS